MEQIPPQVAGQPPQSEGHVRRPRRRAFLLTVGIGTGLAILVTASTYIFTSTPFGLQRQSSPEAVEAKQQKYGGLRLTISDYVGGGYSNLTQDLQKWEIRTEGIIYYLPGGPAKYYNVRSKSLPPDERDRIDQLVRKYLVTSVHAECEGTPKKAALGSQPWCYGGSGLSLRFDNCVIFDSCFNFDPGDNKNRKLSEVEQFVNEMNPILGARGFRQIGDHTILDAINEQRR